MSFVQREMERLGRALCADPRPDREAELYAAQQALAWALDPEVAMSPYEHLTIRPIEAADKDCSAHNRPQTW